ncbi:MFS transporter [Microbacterium sp. AK031]|uniref:MFS transporter n=1 Tax=Microbacterium sp. AK031 TaxID=2723076 RepID=UPI002167072D|nr:MFS transporter [Microbacterium sp. AK031]MCS3842773.1 MFS family permease [Microbacterium sp. AK031]
MKTLMPRDGRVGGAWLTLFAVAWLAVWTVQLTPVQLLLPLQLDTPGGENDWITGVIWSGLILSVGGIAGVIAGPVAGMLSDRTGSRLGRRRPWAIGGALLTAASLLLTGAATEPLGVGAAWVGVSIGIAVISAALTAMIADQVFAQRGTASAFVSSAQAVGIVVGVGAVVLLGLGIGASYVVLAVFILAVGVGTAVLLPDPPVGWERPAARREWRERMGVLRDRNFIWVLASRLTVNIGNALGTALLLFFLLYGVGSPAATAEDDLLVLIVIYTIFVVAASLIAGSLSDRTGRRKPIVILAALVQALSAVMILISPTFIGTAIAAAVMGVGYGAYMAVSLALATDLLPRVEDHARDLGIVNVSASLGQLLGPLLGAALVALVGGFWLLFLVAGILSVIGAVMTVAVRPARVSRQPDPAAR